MGELLLALICPFLIFSFSMGFMYYSNREKTKKLTDFAEINKLSVNSRGLSGGLFSPPNINGDYKGFPFRIYKADGDGRTFIEFSGLSKGFHFNIYRKNFFYNMEKLLGAEFVETGNHNFDSSFIVKSNKPERIKKIMTEEFQHKLLIFSAPVNISFSYGKLEYTAGMELTEPDILTEISNLLYEVAVSIKLSEGLPEKNHGKKQLTDKNHNKLRNFDNHVCPHCKLQVPTDKTFCIMCGEKFI